MPSPASAPRTSVMPEAHLAGHLIGLLAGVASLYGGVEALRHDMPPVLGFTMLVIGGVLPVLAYFSFYFSRAAWSFLCSIMVVLAIVTLFGAPKIRDMLHVPFFVAGLFPFALVIGVVALMLVANDYRGTVSQKSQSAAR